MFPDIAMMGCVHWEIMRQKETGWAVLLRRDARLRAFAEGVMLHENPIGIDRFVHGKNYVKGDGYAMRQGKWLYPFLPRFTEPMRAIIAHGFIESAMEERLRKRNPELVEKMLRVLRDVRPLIPAISRSHARYFGMHPLLARLSIGAYMISTRGLLAWPRTFLYGFQWLTFLREGRLLMPWTFVRVMRLAHGLIDDVEPFLERAINRCKVDWQLLH